MRDRPLLLDLFSGAGGCAMGYYRAGFDVVGVDIKPQPRYPFTFHQSDALEFLSQHGHEFDVIHASPPCQAYSVATKCLNHDPDRPDLIAPTRDLLDAIGKPFVIENVPNSPLARGSLMLCGLMFGLKVFRHRWFESSHLALRPEHPSHRGILMGVDGYVCVAGNGGAGTNKRMRERARGPNGVKAGAKAWRAAMQIDWMNRYELSQAIPPAYTEWIGRQLLKTSLVV